MHRCLYGERGFYTAGTGSAGRRRDFITSPEVGPLFAAVVARWLDAVWTAHGRPDRFPVIDAGAGLGGVPAPWPRTGLRPTARPPGSSSPSILPSAPTARTARRRRGHRQRAARQPRVPHGRRAFRWRRRRCGRRRCRIPGADVRRRPVAVAGPGRRASLRAPARPGTDEAQTWLTDVVRRGAHTILAFDYGAPTTLELVDRGGWLRTYRRHERGDDPYAASRGSGTSRPTSPSTSSSRRRRCAARPSSSDATGSTRSSTKCRRVWQERAARPDVEALVMRSRIASRRRCVDPGRARFVARRRVEPPEPDLRFRRPCRSCPAVSHLTTLGLHKKVVLTQRSRRTQR